jgi:hypothetical protein
MIKHIIKTTTCLMILVLTACSSSDFENNLFLVFKEELATVEKYQQDYIGYMTYQIQKFEQKQSRSQELIRSINTKYGKMSNVEKTAYQQRWQKEFQPLINKIYASTRIMILNQKQNPTQQELAKIQELTIRLEFKQKKAADENLLPIFFSIPNVNPEKSNLKKNNETL